MGALWHYLTANRGQIQGWAVTTIWLAAVPLAAGLALALPVGWLASRYRWSYPPLVSLVGVLYTIPSLVLFLVLPGILGTRILDTVNVAVALIIYSFALLVRTIADGLSSVPAETLAAASAMGYTARQRLFGVQLPLAVPVIGTGARVTAVSNLSLVSVASVIGTSQLGQLFVAGSNLGTLTPIMLGLVCFVILALIFDLLILLAVRTLAPWRRAAAP
jgi:osmoprotectant transport system permease protein